MEEIRRICEGLVPGATTLAEADVALGGGQLPLAFTCDGLTGPWGDPDACDPGAALCLLDHAFYLGDASACAQTPSGPACWYGCGIRVGAEDWSANGGDAIACARRFYGPQPLPLLPR